MALHRFVRLIRVPGQYGLRDLGMLVQRIFDQLVGTDNLAQQRHEHCQLITVNQLSQFRIVADGNHGLMEATVVFHKGVHLTFALQLPAFFHDRFERRSVVAIVDMQGSEPCRLPFERLTDLKQPDDFRLIKASDDGASVGNEFHQTVCRQSSKRLAQWTATDTE